jgi:hypothetical protein
MNLGEKGRRLISRLSEPSGCVFTSRNLSLFKFPPHKDPPPIRRVPARAVPPFEAISEPDLGKLAPEDGDLTTPLSNPCATQGNAGLCGFSFVQPTLSISVSLMGWEWFARTDSSASTWEVSGSIISVRVRSRAWTITGRA